MLAFDYPDSSLVVPSTQTINPRICCVKPPSLSMSLRAGMIPNEYLRAGLPERAGTGHLVI